MKFIIDDVSTYEWPITDLEALFLPTIGNKVAVITSADIAALNAEMKMPRERHPLPRGLRPGPEVRVMQNLARLLTPGNPDRIAALNALPDFLRPMALDAIMNHLVAFQIDEVTARNLIAYAGRISVDEPDHPTLAIRVSPSTEGRSATVTLTGALFDWAHGDPCEEVASLPLETLD